MALLITELNTHVEAFEETIDEAAGKKALYITGPFMEAGVVNRNGRRYPRQIMENEVNRYLKEKVERNCAYGELNHPKGPQIDLDRACILIKELDMNPKGQVIGKARVLNTQKGDTVRGLLESGCNLGVSSRGLGSLKDVGGIMEVQDDFKIVTASDVVADPSAPNAFVDGIMEGVEWIFNETTGEWAEDTRRKYRSMSKSQINQVALADFARFMKSL